MPIRHGVAEERFDAMSPEIGFCRDVLSGPMGTIERRRRGGVVASAALQREGQLGQLRVR